MSRTEVVTLTNMCMVYEGSRVLVQNRVDPEWSGIVFPGGHVEKGESLTDSVIREVWEETGLTIRAPKLCGVKDWVNEDGSRYIVLFYKTDQFEGKLRSSEEGEVFWIELDEFLKMNYAEDMNRTLRVFLEEDLSENYWVKEEGEWQHYLK